MLFKEMTGRLSSRAHRKKTQDLIIRNKSISLFLRIFYRSVNEREKKNIFA
jgi:hypothetical protein